MKSARLKSTICLIIAVCLLHPILCDMAPHSFAPNITIPLDKPVNERLKDLNNQFASKFKVDFTKQLDLAKQRVGSFTYFIGKILITFYMNVKGDPVMYDEIHAIADATGISFADIALLNYFYEASCISIIGKSADGLSMLFASNLDFDFAPFNRAYSYQGIFTKNGETIFIGDGIYGIVGLVRGQRVNNGDNFALSLNERDVERGDFMTQMFFYDSYNIVFFVREVLHLGTYSEAIEMISTATLTTAAYYTIAGTASKGGCIFERAATTVHRKDCIGSHPDTWFLVITNYDRDLPDPSDDYRRIPAEQAIRQNGQAKFTADYLLNLMSTEPWKRKKTDPFLTITTVLCQNFEDQRLKSTWLMYLWDDLGPI